MVTILAVHIKRHQEALATLAFPVLMALLALLFAPQQPASNLSPDFDFELIDLGYGSLTQQELELEIPLPFEPDVEIVPDIAVITEPEIPPADKWQSYQIKRNDTLGSILQKIDVDEASRRFLVSQKLSSYRKLRAGRPIYYKLAEDGELLALRYKTSPELHLNFIRAEDGNMEVTETAPVLSTAITVKQAQITEQNNSLFAASDNVRIPDGAIQQVIDALETRIDFVRDTRVGDNFAVVYEEYTDEDGDSAGPGQVLGLRYVNRGEEVLGLRNPTDGGYYDEQGVSLQRAFLKSPLKFSRISSKFSLRRFHPILKKWRSHRGVDFAAPTNTPIRSTADGVISYIGKKGGYGNVVMIEHFGKYLTLYGHLNKFASKIKRGSKVSQGQVIGYVGSTGLATGPHLHYEFHNNGKQVDPLSAKVPTRKPPLTDQSLQDFIIATKEVREMLNGADGESGLASTNS